MSVIDPNTKPAAIYYNGEKPPHLFKICTDVMLSRLKDQLDQIYRQLNNEDIRRGDDVEY